MLRRQSLIALGVAVVLGLVAVYLANIFLSASTNAERATPEGMTRVAVAAIPLGYGTELTPEKIRFADFPTDSLPPGHFRTAAELLQPGKRRVVLRPMDVNEPILGSKISGEGQGASIAATLPDGRRAATVRINDVSGVAGFIQPNDGSKDVFLHISDVQRAGLQDPREGDKLEYEIQRGQQGKTSAGSLKLA